jgi:PmbA protein
MNEHEALDLCADVVRKGRAADADEIEAYLESSTTTSVSINEGVLESVTSATARGISVRAIVADGLASACGSDLDAAGRADLAAQAVSLARSATLDPARRLPDPQPLTSADLGIYDPLLSSLSVEEMTDLVVRAERASRHVDSRVVGTHIARFGLVVERIAVVNSRGVSASFEATTCYLSLSVIARDDTDAQRGFSSTAGRLLTTIDPEDIGERAGRRALAALGGTVMPTRRTSVVLDPDVVAELLRGLAQALAGDAVFRGRSLFAERPAEPPHIGRTVASAAVDLVDDGRLPGAPSTMPCDGEGVPTQQTPLIADGVLRGFLHNSESAARMGAVSTGNGVRVSYRSLPEVGPTNLVLRPGERAPSALIGSVDDGLYVIGTRNVGGINPVSGDYSVGASGRRIVRGELAEPITGVTLAAPMLDLLKNVQEVGSDLRWVSGQGGMVGAPTVLIDDVTIGGR